MSRSTDQLLFCCYCCRFLIHLIYLIEVWGNTREKKNRDVRNLWTNTKLLGPVHYQRRKENKELTSSSSHHKTQCCPSWTWLPCPVLTLCHRSASPQVHAAQIRCPPCEKKSTSPVHPYHIKTTMKFNYPLLLLVEIEYFIRCYREAMESTEIRKTDTTPRVILDVINDKITS